MANGVGLNAGRILFEMAIVGRGNVDRELRNAETSLNRFAAGLQSFAMDMTLRFSLMSAAVTGFATKAAVDFDKAMNETRRTSGLTRREIDALGNSFLDISKNMPTSNAAQGLADIAQTAGKMGLKSKEEIESFSLAIMKMTTIFDNLDPTETAQKMAQIATAFGIPFDQIERMGSIISEVDNKTIATTSELINFTQATAGAGQNAGLTLPSLVAIGGAIKEVGLRTEVASTAMSQLFSKLASNPEDFAKIVNLDTATFRKKIEEDAVGALLLWLDTLKKLDRESEVKAIRELQLRGVRATNVITLLASRVEVLREVLGVANQEAVSNTSLSRQWDVVNQSVAASLQRVANQGRALGITLGQSFFPVLEAGIRIVQKVVTAFESLPPLIKSLGFSFGVVLALTGPLALFLGNTLKLVIDLAGAFKQLLAVLSVSGGFRLFTDLPAFLSLMGPQAVFMLGFAATMLAFGTAMAFASDNTRDASIATEKFNREMRDGLGQEIKRHQAILQLNDELRAEAELTATTADATGRKALVYEKINKLLPGLVTQSDNLSEMIKRVGDKSVESTSKITGLKGALDELSKSSALNQELTLNADVATLEKSITSAAKSLQSLTLPSFDIVSGLKDGFSDLFEFAKDEGFKLGGIKLKFNPLELRDADLANFNNRLTEAVTQLDVRLKAAFKNPLLDAPADILEFRLGLRSLQEDLIKLGQQRDQLENLRGTVKSLLETKKPTGEVTVFDFEAEKSILEDLKERFETIGNMRKRAKSQTEAWAEAERKAGRAVTSDQQEKHFRSLVVAQNETASTFKAGAPIVSEYDRVLKALGDQFSVLLQNIKDPKEQIKLLGEALALQAENSSGSTFKDAFNADPILQTNRAFAEMIRLQAETLESDRQRAEANGTEAEFLKTLQERTSQLSKSRDAAISGIKGWLAQFTGLQDVTRATSDEIAAMLARFSGNPEGLAKIQGAISALKALENLFQQQTSDPLRAKAEVVSAILADETARFEIERKAADLIGEEDEFLAANETRITTINNLRDETLRLLQEEFKTLTGSDSVMDLMSQHADKFALIIKDPELAKKLLAIAGLIDKLQKGGIQPKNSADSLDDYNKALAQSGLRAENFYRAIQSGFQRASRRIAEMAFDLKLQMKDVWEAMITDFLTIFIDEIFKRTVGKFAADIVSNLFGGAPTTTGPVQKDFLVRDNGTVMGFEPTDTVVGFRNIEGLLQNILPNITGAKFNTAVPALSSNQQPILVTVEPPVVNLTGTMSGQRFLRKEMPGFNRFDARKRA